MKMLVIALLLIPNVLFASCVGLEGENLAKCERDYQAMIRHAQEEAKRVEALEAATPKDWSEPTQPAHIGGPGRSC